MARLREGRANTARGAAHFLRETVDRVRYGGARGQQLTVRADSGFYTHGVVSVCRQLDVRFSITIRQHKSLRNLIEAIPEDAWTPIPYWMDGAAAVAETSYTPFQTEADAAPVRLIVRRVQPTLGSQLALFANYSYHGCITDREGETLELEADHRRHAEIENAIRDLKYGVGLNHLPSGRFPANGAWLAVQVLAHNLVWYVGMRQTNPTWVEENRGPAWSSHPILIEPEQLPGPIAPRPSAFRPRSSRNPRRLLFTVAGVVGPDLPHGELPSLQLIPHPLLHRLGAQRNSADCAGHGQAMQGGVGVRHAFGVPTHHTVVGVTAAGQHNQQADCDDMFRPTRIGSDPQADWLKCLQNDLSAQSRVGPDGTNCPDEQ